MKKYFYLLLIPLCLGVAACSKDDEKTTEQTNVIVEEETSPLIGTWEYVERTSGTYRGSAWTSVDTYTYTFKNDGRYERVDIDTAHYEDEREPDVYIKTQEKGSYAYDSTTRTLSIVPDDNRALSFIVLTLTDNILTLMWEDGEKWTFSKKN